MPPPAAFFKNGYSIKRLYFCETPIRNLSYPSLSFLNLNRPEMSNDIFWAPRESFKQKGYGGELIPLGGQSLARPINFIASGSGPRTPKLLTVSAGTTTHYTSRFSRISPAKLVECVCWH